MVFTCNTCELTVTDAAILRKHYTENYHRYNLKRKTQNLPPVSQENYQQRELEKDKLEFEKCLKDVYKCPYTGKIFKSKGAWDNYCNSKKYHNMKMEGRKKHRDSPESFISFQAEVGRKMTEKDFIKFKKQQLGKAGKWKVGDSPQKRWLYIQYIRAAEEEDDNWEDCDENGSESMEEGEDDGLKAGDEAIDFSDHEEEEVMDPEKLYGPAPVELKPIPPLTDFFDCKNTQVFETTQDLLNFMEKKYNFFLPDQAYVKDIDALLAYICEKIGVGLTCINCNKGFYSLEAVQQHMRETPGHIRINIHGDNAFEYADFYDFDGDSSGDENQMGDEKNRPKLIDLDDCLIENQELILPSGKILGHKDLAKFYKQKFDFIPVGMEYSEYGLNRQKMIQSGQLGLNSGAKSGKFVGTSINHSKALVAANNYGKTVLIDTLLNKYRALNVAQSRAVVKQQARDVRQINTVFKKQFMRLGIKNNKVKQHHFKKQMMNCG